MADRTRIAETLEQLVLTAAVSGSEHRLRAVIERQLAGLGIDRSRIGHDRMGNLWLHCGPDGEPQRLLVAHMDEIGWRISSIRPDGHCHLTPLGGNDAQLYEGTRVHVHTENGSHPAAIAPVSLHITDRQGLGPKHRLGPNELLLDVGADSAEAVTRLGISLLDSVTWPKSFELVGEDWVQARSLDDRFGCAALVDLAAGLEQNPPAVPTILAWAVQEELGLRGARALAQRFGNCSEVIAIDSMTVGSGPRDNRQFNAVQPGSGPALRSFDSTVIVGEPDRQAIIARASELGHALQVGFMPGGNDASVFQDGNALCFAFGVALQYSHSMVERIRLADLVSLCSLLEDWCGADCI
ncbi:M20/M25/M40 family metallo-hydrolase [bacterium]|nr:M20/M25/M40 family metallo-hydrolase [bacterium]